MRKSKRIIAGAAACMFIPLTIAGCGAAGQAPTTAETTATTTSEAAATTTEETTTVTNASALIPGSRNVPELL